MLVLYTHPDGQRAVFFFPALGGEATHVADTFFLGIAELGAGRTCRSARETATYHTTTM